MTEKIKQLRHYVQFDFYTVHDQYVIQLFDSNTAANDEIDCIYENSNSNFELLFDQAIQWCKSVY